MSKDIKIGVRHNKERDGVVITLADAYYVTLDREQARALGETIVEMSKTIDPSERLN